MTGGVIRPSALLKDLAGMWAEAAKDEAEGVLRASSLSLVVVEEGGTGAGVENLLGDLTRLHPGRAIVVKLHRRDVPLEGSVSLQCWMPFGRRQQICSESISLSAPASAAATLVSVISSLLLPDLPVVLWLRAGVPLLRLASPLLPLAGKAVVDSARWGAAKPALAEVAALVSSGNAVGDLAWARLTRWREAIARAFEDAGCRAQAGAISSVSIGVAEGPPPPSACYLAGWIARCLGWKWENGAFQSDGDRMPLLFQTVRQSLPDCVGSVTISGGRFEVSLRIAEGATAEIRVNSLVNRVAFPIPDEAALVSEELSIVTRDRIFEESLRIAARIAAAESDAT